MELEQQLLLPLLLGRSCSRCRLASAALCCLSVYPANIFFKCSVCISERPKRKITALCIHHRPPRPLPLSRTCPWGQPLDIGANNNNTANNGAQIYGSPTRLEAVKMANLWESESESATEIGLGSESGWTHVVCWCTCVCGLFEFVFMQQPVARQLLLLLQPLLLRPGCC